MRLAGPTTADPHQTKVLACARARVRERESAFLNQRGPTRLESSMSALAGRRFHQPAALRIDRQHGMYPHPPARQKTVALV